MAHYSSAACWEIQLVCTKDHVHDSWGCTKSVLVCDKDHIKKTKEQSEKN